MAKALAQSTPLRQQNWIALVVVFSISKFVEVAIVVSHFVFFTPAFLSAIGFDQVEINRWTGLIASSSYVLGIWFVPLWGVLADRYGRKPLILRSYCIEVIAMAGAAVSQNVWFYLIARSLTGLALGNSGLMYAALAETAPRHRVALALSLVNGSVPLGGLVGGLLGGLVVAQYGVRWLFAIDAAVIIFIVILLTFFYHESFSPGPMPRIRLMLDRALRDIIQLRIVRTFFFINFVYQAGYYFSYPYLPVRIGEIVGKSAAPLAIGFTLGIAGATTLIGSAIWGSLAERVGELRLLVFLMLAAMASWLPMYAAQNITDLTIAWAIFSAVNSAVSSLIFTIIGFSVPIEKRGSIMSMVYLPLNFAFLLGPFTASFVATGLEVRAVFLFSAVLSLAAWLILVRNASGTRDQPLAEVDS